MGDWVNGRWKNGSMNWAIDRNNRRMGYWINRRMDDWMNKLLIG